jgi:hypothetical protein
MKAFRPEKVAPPPIQGTVISRLGPSLQVSAGQSRVAATVSPPLRVSEVSPGDVVALAWRDGHAYATAVIGHRGLAAGLSANTDTPPAVPQNLRWETAAIKWDWYDMAHTLAYFEVDACTNIGASQAPYPVHNGPATNHTPILYGQLRFRVRAVDSKGNASVWTEWSDYWGLDGQLIAGSITEGGMGPHRILSSVHTDTDSLDIPVAGDVLVWDGVNHHWEALDLMGLIQRLGGMWVGRLEGPHVGVFEMTYDTTTNTINMRAVDTANVPFFSVGSRDYLSNTRSILIGYEDAAHIYLEEVVAEQGNVEVHGDLKVQVACLDGLILVSQVDTTDFLTVFAAASHTHPVGAHTHVENDITDLDHDAVSLQGGAVAATAPTDGQALVWNDGASQWEPGTVASLTVAEVDGTPTASAVDTLIVPNGTLTDNGDGSVTVDFGSAATDGSAIHDNEAGEIHAVSEKTTPVDDDELLIEDSEDNYAKKRVKIGNLPGGGGTTTFYWSTGYPLTSVSARTEDSVGFKFLALAAVNLTGARCKSDWDNDVTYRLSYWAADGTTVLAYADVVGDGATNTYEEFTLASPLTLTELTEYYVTLERLDDGNLKKYYGTNSSHAFLQHITTFAGTPSSQVVVAGATYNIMPKGVI